MRERYIQLRSGRKFRSIFPDDHGEASDVEVALEQRRLLACDSLYALRPLLHLGLLRLTGPSGWVQWLTPALLDLVSIWGVRRPENLSPEQRGELRRRSVLLLFYLLRSPFYERVTR